MDMDSLKQMFDMHIKECDARDTRNVKSIDEFKGMVKGIWDSQDEMRESITKLQIRIAQGLTALILFGKAVDYYLQFRAMK